MSIQESNLNKLLSLTKHTALSHKEQQTLIWLSHKEKSTVDNICSIIEKISES